MAAHTFFSGSSNLSCLKGDVNITLFGDTALTKRSKERGYLFFNQAYLHDIQLFHTTNNHNHITEVKGKCYRSMKKSSPPHEIRMIICFNIDDVERSRISDSTCSCVAG